ncbi:MAG: ATP-binding protein, partial [Methanomicrobiales archaeon]|nr:ATP-binding protein [Methanomicrobiales archaeon]
MDLVIGRTEEKEFYVDAQELVTGRTCIIAQSGAGKSWAIAVISERLCRNGIGFCLIDTEGEYFSLKDRYSLLWIGSDKHADCDIDTVDIRDVMTKSIRNSTAVIFDVSETDMRERVSDLAYILYDIASEVRLPYLLIIEEG